MATSPLLLDPTRTGPILRRFFREIRIRFENFEDAIIELVLKEDAFGLAPKNLSGFEIRNTRYAFLTDSGKLQSFRDWMQEQFDSKLLSSDDNGEPWTSKYVKSSYKQGAVRSFIDTRKEALSEESPFFKGTKAEFLSSFFNGQTATSKIELVSTRAFEGMKGITGPTAAAMNRVLADGIAHGRGARAVARDLVNEAELGRKRAMVVARTELIHAHAEGQLDSLEALGVEEVGIMVEWSTAGDGKVCQRCRGMAGTIRTIAQARGLIPLHPNCRCAWIPHIPRKSKTKRG